MTNLLKEFQHVQDSVSLTADDVGRDIGIAGKSDIMTASFILLEDCSKISGKRLIDISINALKILAFAIRLGETGRCIDLNSKTPNHIHESCACAGTMLQLPLQTFENLKCKFDHIAPLNVFVY